MFFGWLGLLRVLVVGSCAYLALIVLLRISGKRTLAKLNASDFVITVAIGSTLATVLLSSTVALAASTTARILRSRRRRCAEEHRPRVWTEPASPSWGRCRGCAMDSSSRRSRRAKPVSPRARSSAEPARCRVAALKPSPQGTALTARPIKGRARPSLAPLSASRADGRGPVDAAPPARRRRPTRPGRDRYDSSRRRRAGPAQGAGRHQRGRPGGDRG